MNVERGAGIEGYAAVAGITGLAIGCLVLAVDCFGRDTGTGGFTHTPRTTEQEGMRQLVYSGSRSSAWW